MVKHIYGDFRDRAKPFNKNNSKTKISSRGEQDPISSPKELFAVGRNLCGSIV